MTRSDPEHRPGGRSAPAGRFGSLRRAVADLPVTTSAAAAAFVVLALVLAVVPVPYVAWSPGRTVDVLGPGESEGASALSVAGLPTYPTAGELRLTTVSVTRADARLNLPAALAAHWMPWRDVLPREAVYAPGTTRQESQAEGTRMMDTAQQAAVVAGLRSAGIAVTAVPMVVGVTAGAPADGVLEPGDRLLSVDGSSVDSPAAVVELIGGREAGEPVRLGVLRDGRSTELTVPTRAAADEPGRPVVGAVVGVGYDHPGEVVFGIDPDIGGPSAGLVFALAVHDLVTPGALTAGRVVAGTGTISEDGTVGSIGGIESKLRGADRAGATMLLVPRDNCVDLDGVRADLPVVPVATLAEAVEILSDPTVAVGDLPSCP